MGLIRAEPAAADRGKVDLDVCGSCLHKPYPAAVVWDLLGVGRVAACSDPVTCRRRAETLGIWCTYELNGAAA